MRALRLACSISPLSDLCFQVRLLPSLACMLSRDRCGCAEFKKRLTPHVSSTLAPPNFPSDYLPKEAPKEEGAAAAAVPSKLKLNFFLPHEQQMKAKEVCLPGDRACRLNGNMRSADASAKVVQAGVQKL